MMKNLLVIIYCSISSMAIAINPFMPTTAFIPDGEPHVFEYKGEKRVYVYGSRDERITAFCGYGHDVWSAPVDNLTQWTNHGEIFHVNQVKDIGYGIVDEQHFGAPDCVYNPITKKYYLYTFLGAVYKMDGKEGPLPGSDNYIPGFEDFGPKCVMAVSDSPTGPFINPTMCNWPAANSAGAFDPSVLVDKQQDGTIKVYAYWGMKKGDRWAEIDPVDMHTIINPSTHKQDINSWHRTLGKDLELKGTSVFEANSIKKIATNKYVFIYSSNERKSALTYCYSNSPKGPWSYGGRIIDTGIGWRGGNNHGSIVNINNNWYVIYHRHTSNSYSRQATIEPITVNIEGDKVIIPQVEMTSQGVEKEGLNAFKRYNAEIACYRTNIAYIEGKQRNSDGLDPVVGLDGNNTIIGYKYLNFGNKQITDNDKLVLKLNIKKLKNVEISIQIAKPAGLNEKINLVEISKFNLQDFIISNDTLYHEIIIPIKNLSSNKTLNEIGGLKGKLGLYLAFNGEGKDLCHIKEIEFAKGNSLTPNPLHEIKYDSSKNGSITTLPSKARIGESVKITVKPKKGYNIASIIVKDEKGKKLDISKNCISIYALESYNFFMPNTDVVIETNFIKKK